MSETCIRRLSSSGVIEVMDKARKYGYPGDGDWSNFGQGAPETGDINGLPRISDVSVDPTEHGYAPVSGVPQLREQVAALYNELFLADFRPENVSIAPGGRGALTRIFAGLEAGTRVGCLVPDYAGYEGLFRIFDGLDICPIHLNGGNFKVDLDQLENRIKKDKIQALLLSNPANPTGNVIKGEELKKLVEITESHNVLLVIDEFYFNYYYGENGTGLVSAAEFICDINEAPVVIVAGVSKALRMPGARIGWTVASEKITKNITNAGSSLDGGANHPLQKAVLPFLEPGPFKLGTQAMNVLFARKRDFMIEQLTKLGILIAGEPDGGFYLWADLTKLSSHINTAEGFFKAGLSNKVIVVPGPHFDIGNSDGHETRFGQFVRFSYGPEMKVLKGGIEAIEKVVNSDP